MELRCPFPECGAIMLQKGGDKYVYWECPHDGARLYPGKDVDIWQMEQQYKKQLSKKGGGSKKAGRKRTYKRKKRFPWYYGI